MAARDTKVEVEADHDDELGAIYREHFEFVSCVLHRFGVHAGDLDDATQDVFVVAHGRLGAFEGRAAVRTWLYSIAIRIASNRRRKLARRSALMLRLPRTVPDDLEELAARGQARAILESLLDRLDEPKRVVFVLAELEELAVPTIARMIGENPRTVYSRLRVARARMADELDRLHATTSIDDTIAAARVRVAITPERAQRMWAGVLAGIAVPHATPVLAGTGLSLLGKLAIGGALVAATAIGVVVLDAAPTSVVAEPTPTPTPIAAAIEQPVAPAEIAPRPAPMSTPAVEPAPLAERTTPQRRAAEPEDPTTPASTLADEVALLDDARAHLSGGHGEAALVVLDRYDTRFTGGALRDEASKIRVRALCSAGRERDAIEHARRARLPTPRCSS